MFFDNSRHIQFKKLKLLPLSTCVPFPVGKKVRIGINSFGFGGANGHAIIEEYIHPNPQSLYIQPLAFTSSKYPLFIFIILVIIIIFDWNRYHTFVISAKSSKALFDTARNIAELVKSTHKFSNNEQEILYHLAGNLATRRTPYTVRKYP